VSSFFRRKTADTPDADAAAESDSGVTAAADKAGGKGRPTPKRREAQAQAHRRLIEAPPANRKEAMKRMRERQRAERIEAREGMMRGDQRYLFPRDRGPVRALVRDLVDARRNVGTFFLAGAFVVLLAGSINIPQVQAGANLLWLLMVLALLFDMVMLSRAIKRVVSERFPGTQEKMRSLYMYGALRSTVFRRMRTPRPRVEVGQSV
jgi:hypothetical protein